MPSRMGLSPRVRGNPLWTPRRRRGTGSIPAGAGEPSCVSAGSPIDAVYPRGCGGTLRRRYGRSTITGLSPRVRGNQLDETAPLPEHGSIPAGAGEPIETNCGRELGRVYPRGCGGTFLGGIMGIVKKGLSPRVRGNQHHQGFSSFWRRSIPAGAGEPPSAAFAVVTTKVYPRGCGGTGSNRLSMWAWNGLSPRVRGNPVAGVYCQQCLGSIPAGAGEPAFYLF